MIYVFWLLQLLEASEISYLVQRIYKEVDVSSPYLWV